MRQAGVSTTSLADRVRDELATRRSLRAVNMFGGLAFMVNDRMVVSAGRDGALLVRVDPRRSAELLAITGARPAEMGAGRAMGDGWISVEEEAVEGEDNLRFWLCAALEFNAANGNRMTRR